MPREGMSFRIVLSARLFNGFIYIRTVDLECCPVPNQVSLLLIKTKEPQTNRKRHKPGNNGKRQPCETPNSKEMFEHESSGKEGQRRSDRRGNALSQILPPRDRQGLEKRSRIKPAADEYVGRRRPRSDSENSKPADKQECESEIENGLYHCPVKIYTVFAETI